MKKTLRLLYAALALVVGWQAQAQGLTCTTALPVAPLRQQHLSELHQHLVLMGTVLRLQQAGMPTLQPPMVF